MREESICAAQTGLIASGDGMTPILDKPGDIVVGLMMLHNLLCAQKNLGIVTLKVPGRRA